jgi:hypothetical protein
MQSFLNTTVRFFNAKIERDYKEIWRECPQPKGGFMLTIQHLQGVSGL